MSLFLLFALALTPTQGPAKQPEPVKRAHAHNDYEHPRPLLDALDNGFCSVEADIYLTNQGLLVAHTPITLKPDRTLEKLYLDTLRERAKTNGGRIYSKGPVFYLLVDVKSDAKDTYAALSKVLEKYADILTVTRDGKTETKAVTVVISGNRDVKTMTDQKVRYASIDGRPADLDGDSSAELIPWVSAAWNAQFKWNGTGAMPGDERKRLNEFIVKAHKQGRMVRFWATPERPEVWRELLAADVDFLNTDKLADLAKFLRENDLAVKK